MKPLARIDTIGGKAVQAEARKRLGELVRPGTTVSIPSVDDAADLLHKIAMDLGKQIVDHIEHAYPNACDAVAWDSARTSIRNSTYNSFMEAVRASAKGELDKMLERHDDHRRTMRKLRKAAGQKF